jgi:hypothetical protein
MIKVRIMGKRLLAKALFVSMLVSPFVQAAPVLAQTCIPVDPYGRPCVEPAGDQTVQQNGNTTFHFWHFRNGCSRTYIIDLKAKSGELRNCEVLPESVTRCSCFDIKEGFCGGFASWTPPSCDEGQPRQNSPTRLQQDSSPKTRSSSNPSFDCSKAITADETAICDDTTLAELDRKAAEQWSRLKTVDPDGARRIGREFLRERRACGSDRNCIRAAQERVISTYRETYWDAADVAPSSRNRELAQEAKPQVTDLPQEPGTDNEPSQKPRPSVAALASPADDSFSLPPLQGGYQAVGSGAGPTRHDAIGSAISNALANTYAGEGNRTPSGLQVSSCSQNSGSWSCEVKVSYRRSPGAPPWRP